MVLSPLEPDFILRCEVCNLPYHERTAGDMADLNNLCRPHAEEVAHQLSVDYNLPESCSDEERQAALGGGNPNEPYYVYECTTSTCIRRGKVWWTQITREGWQNKYGREPLCFRCGQWSLLVARQFTGISGA